MVACRVPISGVLIAARHNLGRFHRTLSRQFNHALPANAFLSRLVRDVQPIEHHAIVGMERAPASEGAGGRPEIDPLTLRENALHRRTERPIPHVGRDPQRPAGSNAGNEYAVLTRHTEIAEIQAIHGRLGVVLLLVDGNLFQGTVGFGQLGLAGEHGLARNIHQVETVRLGRATAALAVLVHAHPEGEIGPFVWVVGPVAGLDRMHRQAARVAGSVGRRSRSPDACSAREADHVGGAFLEPLTAASVRSCRERAAAG